MHRLASWPHCCCLMPQQVVACSGIFRNLPCMLCTLWLMSHQERCRRMDFWGGQRLFHCRAFSVLYRASSVPAPAADLCVSSNSLNYRPHFLCSPFRAPCVRHTLIREVVRGCAWVGMHVCAHVCVCVCVCMCVCVCPRQGAEQRRSDERHADAGCCTQ